MPSLWQRTSSLYYSKRMNKKRRNKKDLEEKRRQQYLKATQSAQTLKLSVSMT
jgi:hypothetical protein